MHVYGTVGTGSALNARRRVALRAFQHFSNTYLMSANSRRSLLLPPHCCGPLRTPATASQESAAASEERLAVLQTGVTFSDCECYLFPRGSGARDLKFQGRTVRTTRAVGTALLAGLCFQTLLFISDRPHSDVNNNSVIVPPAGPSSAGWRAARPLSLLFF